MPLHTVEKIEGVKEHGNEVDRISSNQSEVEDRTKIRLISMSVLSLRFGNFFTRFDFSLDNKQKKHQYCLLDLH
jgi:hypothetical protein